MKLCVYGLWHLGCVTAACCAAAGMDTTGADTDVAVVADLQNGKPPLFEPGLEDLIGTGLKSKLLKFSSDVAAAVAAADIVWVTIDTPVDDEDRADTKKVMDAVRQLFSHLRNGAVVLISSQLPVGSTRRLRKEFA